MHRNIDEITQEIVSLPKSDRLKLAKVLLFLDDKVTNQNDTDIQWQEEISQRVLAVESGEAIGKDFDDSIHKIRHRLSQ